MKAGLCLVVLTVLCGLVVWTTLGVTFGNLPYPFFSSGDLFQVCRWYRGLVTHGTIYSVPELGAPFGASHLGWPLPFSIDMPLLWGLSLFTDNLYLIYNAIYVLGFPLCAWGAYWALRRFGAEPGVAIAGGLLYAFLPNRLARYEHLVISLQFATPAVAWLATQLHEGRKTDRQGWLWVTLAAFCSIYSAFFCCAITLFMAVVACIRRRDWRVAWPGLSLCLWCGFLTVVLLLPALLGSGDRPAAPFRHPHDIALYSLSADRLFIPSDPQWSHPLAGISANYGRVYPRKVGFRESAYIGLLPAAGLIALLLGLGRDKTRSNALGSLTVLVVFLFILCSAEGLAPIVSQFLGRGIRAYNRSSFYIAFAGIVWLATVGVTFLPSRGVRLCVVWMLTLFGVWEHSRSLPEWQFDEGRSAATSSEEFLRQLQRTLPAQSMIWQAPYIAYPETAQLKREGEYTWAQLYIPGSNFRWSWGDLKGSRHDDLREAGSHLPWAQQLHLLEQSGFAGIVVLRPALADSGHRIERELANLGLKCTLVSADRRFAFFPLPTPKAPAPKTFADIVSHLNTERSPLVFTTGAGGCTRLREGWSLPEKSGVWTVGKRADLDIPDMLPRIHPARQQSEVTLDLTPFVPHGGQQRMVIRSADTVLGEWSFARQRRQRVSISVWLPVRVTIEIANLAPLGSLPGKDKRELGVMLHRLEARRLPVYRTEGSD